VIPAPDETVVVPLTAPGAGGIAVVALCGPGRFELARRLLGRAAPREPGSLQRATLWLDGEPADAILALALDHRIELHLHGSPALLGALERAVGGFASPSGDPARRLAATALGDAQLALALEQQSGPRWADFLAELRMLPPAQRTTAVAAARRRSAVAAALVRPQRLVLCGARNAGKSTLMNRLLFDDRVLAGAEPGLTRDPVREHTVLAGYPYQIVDTAGEAHAPDTSELERRAIELGRRERRGSLTLAVVDGSVGPGPVEAALAAETPVDLWIRNKSDLPRAPWPEHLHPSVTCSALDPAEAPSLRTLLGETLRSLRGLPPAGPVGGLAALDAAQHAALDAWGPSENG
jgi:tRNA U34 5-carboxymethylaminomethyl modifying GTPase MnmE/TrmE